MIGDDRSVVGLDPSVTSFGFGRVHADGSVESRSIVPKKRKGVDRLRWIRDQVMMEVERETPRLVVMEGYAFSRVNLTHLGEVVGVVKVALVEESVDVVTLTPGGLKKFVTGRGNAKKDEMRLEVYKRFEFEAASQDEIEAVALAYAGWHWLGVRGELSDEGIYMALDMVPQKNMEALDGKRVEVVV